MGDSLTPHLGAFHAPPEGIAEQTPRRDDSWIIIAVIAIGALVAISGFLALIDRATFGDTNFGAAFGGLFDFAYLIVGVGLMFRRELARQVFIVFAVIALIGFTWGAITYTTRYNQALATGLAQKKAQIQAEITRIQDNPNPGLGGPGRQRNLAGLQEEVRQWQAQHSSVSATSRYAGFIPLFLPGLISLVFLTRPAVKRVFVE
jgi:hypothetical protein